jgi:hypothetical protein
MVSVITGRIPPGMACRIRKATSLLRSQASPHIAEVIPNASTDQAYTRCRPNRSPSQPLTGTITPRASE